MNIVVLTPIRLLGDGLAACINDDPLITTVAVVGNFESLRRQLRGAEIQLVLIDVSQGLKLSEVRGLCHDWPSISIVALGLLETQQEVIQCGQAGYAGYISRETPLTKLCANLVDIVAGKQTCPPEISAGMLRALSHTTSQPETAEQEPTFTMREREVLELIGQGMSNKDIGKQLSLSVPTVKHHVHNILGKLGLTRRIEVMKKMRDPSRIV